ncbi:uncharacterized protein FPRN_00270 [Fusarium proliferatum]|nr:uncharacterized protein FPRN_00270 [Fusarium proliferatum]
MEILGEIRGGPAPEDGIFWPHGSSPSRFISLDITDDLKKELKAAKAETASAQEPSKSNIQTSPINTPE